MKKKVLFSLFGMLALVGLAFAAGALTPSGLSNDIKMRLTAWDGEDYPYIVKEAGYVNTDASATSAQDSIKADIARLELWKGSSDALKKMDYAEVIGTAKLAYDSITIQQFKNVNASALAVDASGNLTSTDTVEVNAAIVAYNAIKVEGTKEVATWLPGIIEKLTERKSQLGVDDAYTQFLTAIEVINARTTEALGGKENLHLGTTAVIKNGANDDYTYLKTIKDSYTELAKNKFGEKAKHNIDSIYNERHINSLLAIYEAMDAAKTFLENDTVANYALINNTLSPAKIPVTSADLTTAYILNGDFQNIHMIYQKVVGAPEFSADVLKYIDEILPEAYLKALHDEAVSTYKQKDRYIISDNIGKEYVKTYVGLAPTKDNYARLEEAKAVYNNWYVVSGETTSTSLKNLNHTAIGHEGYVYESEAFTEEELLLTGELAQKYIRTKSAVTEGPVYRKLISDSLQVATCDTIAHSIAEAYKAVYNKYYEDPSIHDYTSVDSAKLAQAIEDKVHLAGGSCSVEGAKEGRYYLWDGWVASTKENADTMKSVSDPRSATDGIAIKNLATSLIKDYTDELASKLAGKTWLDKWDAFAHSIENLTTLQSEKLDSIKLALADYNTTLNARAKKLVDPEYKLLKNAKDEAEADVVDAKINNLGFLYGNGVWVDSIAGTLKIKEIPRSWKAIKALVDAERAKAKSDTALWVYTNAGADSIKVAPRFFENAVAFVAGDTYAPTDTAVALLKDNIVAITSWTDKTAKANKIEFNTYAPYQAPITVAANQVDLTLRVRPAKFTAFYVPFNIDKDTLALMNDNDMNVYYVGGAKVNEVEDSVIVDYGLCKKNPKDYATGETAVYAYKPYFITGKNEYSNAEASDKLTFKDVTIEISPVAGDLDLDGDTIKANGEGYVVCSGGKYNFTFVGSTQDIKVAEGDYWFNVAKQTFWVAKSDFTWNTGKGNQDKHIAIRPSVRGIHYAISYHEADENEVTGIQNVNIQTSSKAAGIYTINGVKVNNMSKPGLYIVNGKKVLVK